MSWLCLLLGGALGWSIEGVGVIWRISIIPAYVVLLLSAILVGGLGGWAVPAVALALPLGVDLALRRLAGSRGGASDPGD